MSKATREQMLDVAREMAEQDARHTRDQPTDNSNGGGQAPGTQPNVTLQWDCMADIEPEAVDWIWPGRIARGKLTLIAGDPGMGKSQIGLDVAAHITNADRFPDGSKAPSGSVLILTAEDSAKDTVRPRCEAAGADLKRVHRLKAAVTTDGTITTFRLQEDLAALTATLNAIGDVLLVIIDPITSYMVAWDDIAVSISADEALAATTKKDGPAMSEAKEFLREELAAGERPATQLKKAAGDAGLTWGTVKRAQKAMGIKPRKNGLAGGWIWQLPEESQPAKDRRTRDD
jgi:hypothetical protein